MIYEKLTLVRFGLKLHEGAYKGVTGANRALGKSGLTPREKAEATKMIAEYFKGRPSVPSMRWPHRSASRDALALVEMLRSAVETLERSVATREQKARSVELLLEAMEEARVIKMKT